jgi:prefoldin subunit 5
MCLGIPGRIVESKEAEDARFAAYAVVQEHSDPYAKAIQQLVEHSQELERSLARLQARMAEMEREAEQSKRQLTAVK